MNRTAKIAVCSRSFSQNPTLRAALLERYEHVTFNDEGVKLRDEALVNYLRGHDKAITALEVVDEPILAQLPELQVVSKYGVGLDTIDAAAMRKHGRRLGWTPGVNCRSVAELVIAFAICMLRHVPAARDEVLAGTWRQHIGSQLTGKTVGIIGCGHAGKEVVRLLQPFRCPILVYDIRDYPEFFAEYGIEVVDLEDLLRRSDIVTLHVPLDDGTRDMITAERLDLMKPSALLINAARGQLVDENALKARLQSGRLAAAAFDVFATEPPADMDLLRLSNFLVTPHIGGSSIEAILAMGRAAIDGLDNNAVP